MRCPTCKKDGLLVTTRICPRCETQITSDYELEDDPEKVHRKEFSLLKGKIVELARRKERTEQRNSRLRGWNLLIILILIGAFFFRKKQEPVVREVESGQMITALSDSLTSVENKVRELQRQISTRNTRIIQYPIQKGDNLTKISNLFYNDPALLVEIARENNIPIPDRIIEGDTLDILIFK